MCEILNKLIDPDNNKKQSIISLTRKYLFLSLENNKFPFLIDLIEDITVQLTLVLQSRNVFILPEFLTLLPQATPNIHFKETIMRKNMQLLHYDCCVPFGKQNIYPIITTAGSI